MGLRWSSIEVPPAPFGTVAEDTLMTEDGYARTSAHPGMGKVLNDRAPLIAEADLVLLEGESVGPFLGEADG